MGKHILKGEFSNKCEQKLLEKFVDLMIDLHYGICYTPLTYLKKRFR